MELARAIVSKLLSVDSVFEGIFEILRLTD